jgi:hypothetical protein
MRHIHDLAGLIVAAVVATLLLSAQGCSVDWSARGRSSDAATTIEAAIEPTSDASLPAEAEISDDAEASPPDDAEVADADGDAQTGDCDAQSCSTPVPACEGNAGQVVCDGSGALLTCAEDGSVQSQQSCISERHCQLGLAGKACALCVPDEFYCTGALLQQCNKDGRGYSDVSTCETAALCKAEAGACTAAACVAGKFACQNNVLRRCNASATAFEDVATCGAGLCDAVAGECDVCTPNQRRCEPGTNTALICNASGQTLDRSPCTAPRDRCVGAGQCVSCATDVPCPASTTICKSSACVLATNSCELRNDKGGTNCSLNGQAGACDGAGACLECWQEGDGRCTGSTPHCNSAHKCVRCTANSHCGNPLTEKCVAGACRLKCGDGVIDSGEDCEQGVSGWNSTNCDFATCKRTNYVTCNQPDVICKTDTRCVDYCMPFSDSNCVTSCPTLPGFMPACRTGICYLACDIASGAGCPSDMHCELASPNGSAPSVGICLSNDF